MAATLDVLGSGGLVMLQSNSSQVFTEMLHQFTSGCPHNGIQSLNPVALRSCEAPSPCANDATGAATMKVNRNPFGVISETEAAAVASGKIVHRTVLQAC